MDSNYDFNGPDEASVVLPERIERSAKKRLQAFIDEALQTEREQRRALQSKQWFRNPNTATLATTKQGSLDSFNTFLPSADSLGKRNRAFSFMVFGECGQTFSL